MDINDFAVLWHAPGRIGIGVPPAAIPFLPMALLRLRGAPAVRAARLVMPHQAIELDYDAERHSVEGFLTEVARALGVPLDVRRMMASLPHGEPIVSETPAFGQNQIGPAIAPAHDAPSQSAETGQPPDGEDGADGWSVRSAIAGRTRQHHPMIASSPYFRDAVERRLTAAHGVTVFKASPVTGTVLVVYDPALLSETEVTAALRQSGRLALAEATAADADAEVFVDTAVLRLIGSTFSLALSAASLLLPALRPVATGVAAWAGSHLVLSAARALLVEHRLRVDVLDATVVTVALGYQKLLAAGFLIWVLDVSDALLAASSRTQRRNLAELFGRQARRAWRLEDGLEVDRPVSELGIDDIIVVRAGDHIPVDGEVLTGEASVDRSALTGEHAAMECVPGDPVFAMTVVLTGSLQILVRKTGADTTAARMVQIVADSLDHKPELQSLAERFAETMVTPTFGLGAVAYGIAGPGPMLAVINADFGTGIRIAGPLAMLSSLSVAAKNGILIKKGQVLEDLARMNAVVFDKTGTLTEDIPVVGRILVIDDKSDADQILAYAAAAEQRFSHPIAKGIIRAAEARGLSAPAVEEAGYELGLGVRVGIAGRSFFIGSLRYMLQQGVAVPEGALAFSDAVHRDGGTAIFAAIDQVLAGVLELCAVAREEAAGLVQYLKDTKGIDEIHLLSGDHDVPVAMLARQLGIPHHQAGMLPQEKADYIRALQARGLRVAMFGDGVNDTGGLAQADYSISLRGAADAATDVADVVFLDGSLAKFPVLDEISSNLTRNVKRSFALAVVPNSICIAGAMAGVFGLGASLVFNNVGNLVTVANGMRAQSRLDAARTHSARSIGGRL